MTKITKDTKLAEILKKPGAAAILEKHNTPCLHCPMAAYEMGSLTIGRIAKTYGINLKTMLLELNKKAEKKKAKK
jgi:hypothetical protein